MKIVLQRVSCAAVRVDGRIIGNINKGYVVFLGIGADDTEKDADRLIDKIEGLRIFPDECGKINLSSKDVKGEILIISQFTLYADCRKGNRPSFTNAADPVFAEKMYDYFVKACNGRFKKTACGEFGADMKVELVNDGPFTVLLD